MVPTIPTGAYRPLQHDHNVPDYRDGGVLGFTVGQCDFCDATECMEEY